MQKPEPDIESQYSDSDVEYWKIEPNGTMNIVFRAPQYCKACRSPHFVFIMRKDDRARCMECDRMKHSFAPVAV